MYIRVLLRILPLKLFTFHIYSRQVIICGIALLQQSEQSEKLKNTNVKENPLYAELRIGKTKAHTKTQLTIRYANISIGSGLAKRRIVHELE